MISELNSLGIPVARNLLVDELRAMVRQHRTPVRAADEMEEVEEKSILAKMRSMKKEELERECMARHIEVNPKMVKGDLMIALRAWFRDAGTAQTVINFGRYSKMTFEEVLQNQPGYAEWVVKEMKSQDVSPELEQFGIWIEKMKGEPLIEVNPTISVTQMQGSSVSSSSTPNPSMADIQKAMLEMKLDLDKLKEEKKKESCKKDSNSSLGSFTQVDPP